MNRISHDGDHRLVRTVIGNEAPAAPWLLGRETLIAEIERYLNTVDFFRTLDCEPVWRTELA